MDTMKHKLKLIEHIFNGGLVKDDINGGTFKYDRIANDKPEEDNEFLMFVNIDNMSIHLDEKDIHILKLEAAIDVLNEQVELLTKQKRKVAKNAREQQENNDRNKKKVKSPYRAHLQPEEVREIEKIFTHDFRTKGNIVMSAYGMSEPVVSKIRLGKHCKSSSIYIEHLKNIGQWDK